MAAKIAIYISRAITPSHFDTMRFYLCHRTDLLCINLSKILWRQLEDSNPRRFLSPYLFSRQTSSTAGVNWQIICPLRPIGFAPSSIEFLRHENKALARCPRFELGAILRPRFLSRKLV